MSETLANYYANKKEEKKSSWFWSCSDDDEGRKGNLVKAFLAHSVSRRVQTTEPATKLVRVIMP